MLGIYRMSVKIITFFLASATDVFPPCFFSKMNDSFPTNKEQACFNYPMVTEWQSASQPEQLPSKITAQSNLSLFQLH